MNNEELNDNGIRVNDRLFFIKTLLTRTNINPIVDLNLCSRGTEYFHKDINKETYNFSSIISKIGGKLKYIKSGTTGHTFQGILIPNEKNKKKYISYAVKVVAYPCDEDDNKEIYNIERPENAELQILKVLSQFVITNQTPHIVLPLITFNSYIEPFILLKENNYVNNKRYNSFVDRYKKGELHNIVSILISEWANGGDLLEYFRTKMKNIDVKEWRVLLFQIFSVLAVIHRKYPGFRHNDMKANNILLQIIDQSVKGQFFRYQIDGTIFYVPNIGYQIKLWDFDFACIGGVVENSKVNLEWTNSINITKEGNRYYDICFFIVSLQRPGFLQEVNFNEDVPKQVLDFFNSIVPQELINSPLINERGRLLCDIEYTTPQEILLKHPFFNKLRPKDNRVEDNTFIPSGLSQMNKLLKKNKHST